MFLEEAGELCRYFLNELIFSNLIKYFVHCVCKFNEFVVRIHCAVMVMHSFKCVI
jgi:hypothetical protein